MLRASTSTYLPTGPPGAAALHFGAATLRPPCDRRGGHFALGTGLGVSAPPPPPHTPTPITPIVRSNLSRPIHSCTFTCRCGTGPTQGTYRRELAAERVCAIDAFCFFLCAVFMSCETQHRVTGCPTGQATTLGGSLFIHYTNIVIQV